MRCCRKQQCTERRQRAPTPRTGRAHRAAAGLEQASCKKTFLVASAASQKEGSELSISWVRQFRICRLSRRQSVNFDLAVPFLDVGRGPKAHGMYGIRCMACMASAAVKEVWSPTAEVVWLLSTALCNDNGAVRCCLLCQHFHCFWMRKKQCGTQQLCTWLLPDQKCAEPRLCSQRAASMLLLCLQCAAALCGRAAALTVSCNTGCKPSQSRRTASASYDSGSLTSNLRPPVQVSASAHLSATSC